MMEKRNFVTSARTPIGGASDIDDVIDAGARAMGCKMREAGTLEKKASQEDERSDSSYRE